jgi:hypothetical protein
VIKIMEIQGAYLPDSKHLDENYSIHPIVEISESLNTGSCVKQRLSVFKGCKK